MDNRLTAGGGADEFFARLGPSWLLTDLQRRRLAPLAVAALEAGWDPLALAAFAGANTAGVRSPFAVLAARLQPAELPAPPGRARARPPWCGACDERTRLLHQADGTHPGRCPACHPLTTGITHQTGGTPEACGGASLAQTACTCPDDGAFAVTVRASKDGHQYDFIRAGEDTQSAVEDAEQHAVDHLGDDALIRYWEQA